MTFTFFSSPYSQLHVNKLLKIYETLFLQTLAHINIFQNVKTNISNNTCANNYESGLNKKCEKLL